MQPPRSMESLAGVQSALDSETAVIGWLDVEMSDDETAAWVYVIRDTGPVRWERLEGARPTSVRLVRDALTSAGGLQLGVRSYGERLWRERVEPATQALAGARRLVVIPSGLRMGVPVEALRDDTGRFLADRYDVSYAPSATIRRPPTRHTGSRRALLVGDPLFPREGLLPLPASRDEVNEIAAAVPNSTVLLGGDASEQRLCELAESGALEDFDVIHLATHALVDNDRPGRSAVALTQVDLPDPLEAARSGSRVYDGWLSASEIAREWKLEADLVVLSACETALGKEVGGEGYVGLAHTFLQVGARSVVVSLWKVDDAATALLMHRFYNNLFGGRAMPSPRALAEAKRWLRSYQNSRGERLYEHPFYWSSFVLIESGR
jgi:CHAT domain-containing protein